MTDNVSTGGQRETRELGHQIGDWVAEIDRDTHALREHVSELRQKYVRLIALAEEMRDDMKRVCLDFDDFDDFDDDLGHISDAINRMNLRTTRFQVGIARNVSLLESLDNQSG
ncbi:MAG TPA: hypothetical protein VGL93_18860 [Streptosporangiaceae bacterium]|jgi:hypothetical protein